MNLHQDFSDNATLRANQMEWSSQLSQLAVSNESDTVATYGIAAPCTLRPLLLTEIMTLQTTCRCRSSDWSKLRLLFHDGVQDQSERLEVLVSDSAFEGTVVLILIHTKPPQSLATEGDDWVVTIPVGIHGCAVVANSMIHIDSARVHRCTVISDTYVDAYAVALNCGRICCSSSFLLEPFTRITVGPESGGGRTLQLTPESTMIEVGQELLTSRTQAVVLAKKQHLSCFNMIGSHCIVRDTATLDTIYLHPGSCIESASLVRNTILFPTSTITNASTVKNAILQWNCKVTDCSNVSDALLMEHAAAGPSSVVANAVLGPDVHVSGGEVQASVLGPNCNAHHQSLLIAVLWPTGRGNVGYGANVGSNHTGRIPDQECCAGEGVFWGLSCVVKFPVDLSSAPYTIVAAGTNMSPQRCTMPFSLIVSSENGDGGTSIIPGWVLQNSPYTIVRSETKFATRRKATRHSYYTGWKIMRPETIDLCVVARRALQSVRGGTLYDSDSTIPGIGASQLSEKSRLAGIQAYTECIQLFALQGLYNFLVAAIAKRSGSLDKALAAEYANAIVPSMPHANDDGRVFWPVFPWDVDQSSEAFWKSQRTLLMEEFPIGENFTLWVRDLLRQFLVLEKSFADRVYKCKQRDDSRGIATIPDYSSAHVLADQDPVIAGLRAELKRKNETVQDILEELYQSQRSAL